MSKKIIVALDSDNLSKIIKLVKVLKPEVFAFKLGYQFFLNFGFDGYKKVYSICPKIFLDLKLNDIPNTVRKGIKAISKIKPLLTTIHISGGDEMMKASILEKKNTKILGVSILTSINDEQSKKFFNQKNISSLVKKFTKAAMNNKLDGIVCSPNEIEYVRKIVGKKFIIVTPGIRVNKKIKSDDQKRISTPKKALELGADYLVIGRPITESRNPLKVLREINKTLI